MTRARRRLGGEALGLTAALLVAAIASCGTPLFLCQTDSQCGADGACTADGFCSFPDSDCPSGWRFGEDTGSMSRQCVPEGAGTGESTAGSASASASGSGDGTSAGSTTLASTTMSTSTSGTDESESDVDSGSESNSESASGSTGKPPQLFCEDPNGTLLLCLDFSDVSSPVIPDGSSYGNDANASGVGQTDSPYGPAAAFGPGATVSVADHPSLSSEAVTVEAWFQVEDLPLARMGIVDKEAQYSIFVYADGTVQCGGTMGVRDGAVEGGTWTFVACVFDGAAWSLYIDGVFVAPGGPGSGSDPVAGDLVIGANAPDFSDPFLGGLRGLKLWSAALDPDTIAGHLDPAAP